MQIRIEDLSKIYSPGLPYETKALDHVSFTVEAGEFIGIIGHTGSGKTTLVQSIAGLLEPSDGRIVSVHADGTETVISQKGKESALVRRKVGIVFQYPEYQLFEETVMKDVCFGPKNQGLSLEEQKVRARAALDLVGIDADDKGEVSPFELSGGQKRRVAIAGVLAMRPEVLILDEPTAGLDPKGHDDILEMIRRIRQEMDMSIILVSHNMDDVAEYADRVLVMNHGQKVFLGTPKEVYCEHEQELREIGLDIPSCPSFLWQLKNRGMDVDDNKLEFEETAQEIIRAVKSRWQ